MQEADAILYPCLTPDTMRRENILSDNPLYDLKKIGFTYGYPCIMNEYHKYNRNQLFSLMHTNVNYPSFVSDNVLNRGGELVSGLHCQEGQESRISILIHAYPSLSDNPETQTGGKKKKRHLKKKKSNRRKKTIKKRHKHNHSHKKTVKKKSKK